MLIVTAVYLTVCFLSWTAYHVAYNHPMKREWNGGVWAYLYQNTDELGWFCCTVLWPLAFPILALCLTFYYAARALARRILRVIR